MTLSKNAKFWASRIGVMVAVMAGALAFLLYAPESGTSQTAADSKLGKNITESVSRFYEEFRQTSRDPIKEQFGEYTILLEGQNDLALDKAIEQVSPKTYRPTQNWEGAFKQRAFAEASTLMQEARAHAVKEGFNLVWDLNQDFIIRNRYQSTNTLIGMLEEIAGAVDSNFNQPILVYFCEEKRALVITVRESDYLSNHCYTNNRSFQSY